MHWSSLPSYNPKLLPCVWNVLLQLAEGFLPSLPMSPSFLQSRCSPFRTRPWAPMGVWMLEKSPQWDESSPGVSTLPPLRWGSTEQPSDAFPSGECPNVL